MMLRKGMFIQSVATMTAGAMLLMACATESTPADLASREVTLNVSLGVTGASGQHELQPFTSQTVRLDAMVWSRELVVDGVSTDAVSDIYTAQQILVPLNTGGTATIERHGDVFELVAADGAVSMANSKAAQAVRVSASSVELFREGNLARSAADVVISLDGIQDLEAPQAELVATLALTALLGSLDQQEQIVPAVAIALIAAALGATYMAICGGTVAYCANHCSNFNAFEVKCGGMKIKTKPFQVDIGGIWGCRCYN